MSETIQLRQKNPEESDKMAKLEEPDGDVYGYVARPVADQIGEYFEVDLSEEADVNASLDGVTGSGSGNYATFETTGGNIVGFGVALDLLEDVFDTEIERDEDDVVTNAPDSLGMTFRPSTEDDYDDAAAVDEEEAEALIGGTDDSDEEEAEDEPDEEEEADELVEIDDGEIGLEQ